MTIDIQGTLAVPMSAYMELSLSPYVYDKKGGETVSSFFGERKKILHFPRNYQKFARVNRGKLKDIKIIDNRVSVPLGRKLPIKDSFNLRDYQEQPVADVIKWLNNNNNLNSCLLQAGTGYGKTYVLPKIVQQIGQRTLILVDRTLLVKQMYDEFTHNTTADIRILSSSNMELGDVNIATFQLFLKNPKMVKKLAKNIGFIIVDEAHVSPADTFSKVVASLPAKYRLGLSATPTRSDGLTEIISDIFGYKKVIGDNPNKLAVNLVAVKTGIPINYIGQKEFAEKFSAGVTSERVMSLLQESIESFIGKDRKFMVYSTYKVVQETVQELLTSMGLKVAIINSKVSHVKRDKIIADFNSGKLDGLIAGVIMSKGISIHRLDTIISLSTHNKESMTQLIGRLRRDFEGKQKALYVDFGFSGTNFRSSEERFVMMSDIKDKSDKFFLYSRIEYQKILRR